MKLSSLPLFRQFAQPRVTGGLRLPRNKPGLLQAGSIRTLALPPQLILPLLDYRRQELTAMVRTGQQVRAGQTLAPGLIAPASGRIVAVEARPVIHPSGKPAPCIILEPDSADNEESACHEALPTLTVERLQQCAVHGLGGAAFATAEKFSAARPSATPLQILLINAVECEPLIACDEALLMCEAAAVLDAIGSLMQATECQRCVLAIENDKHAAIDAVRLALRDRPLDLELVLLEPIYPAGAERSLIRRITGRPLPPGARPASHGILSINVATALAAHRAQQGFPQCSRIVTLGGAGLPEPVNVRVRFGTPVSEVLRQCHYQASLDSHRIRANGPLSGFDLASLQAPVTAGTNCLVIRQEEPPPQALPCIRCGACEEVCPEQLLPQQLYWYAQADDLSGTRRFGLDSCITCGCCDIVCPSSIPLTQTFRYARDAQREQDRQETLAAESQQRFEARERRLAQRAAAREEKRRLAKAQLSAGKDPIAEALARARKRRKPRAATAPASPSAAPSAQSPAEPAQTPDTSGSSPHRLPDDDTP